MNTTDLDFSGWLSFFVDTCFLGLGLIGKFDDSSFAFSEDAVRPFFFTGSWRRYHITFYTFTLSSLTETDLFSHEKGRLSDVNSHMIHIAYIHFI